jgi:hypothetical protein
MSHHPLYKVYTSMMDRCYQIGHHAYADYGGRGIRVCVAWKSDRSKFFTWALSSGYRLGLTLDREDNNKGYCPSNCRFVTRAVQANNRRSNVMLEFGGKKGSMSYWARVTGLKPKTLAKRIRDGWGVKEAISTNAERNGWKRRKNANTNFAT